MIETCFRFHRLVCRPRSRAGLATALGAVLLASAAPATAEKPDTVTFCTNWFAEAEHGGFYQAVAAGIYERYGLDVTIRMGGAQVNDLQLLLAGQCDFTMGYAIRAINAVKEGLPVVTVAAMFQSDPQAIIAHEHVSSLEELKGTPILVSVSAETTFWPWLRAKYGYTDDMKRPYQFTVAPFLADKNIAQQGYVTSEPFAIEQAGAKAKIFLLADHGYPPYATTIETTHEMVKEHPDVVRSFVAASIEGYERYLDDPQAGNALIKKDNPEMSDAQLAFGLTKLKEHELVTGGDAKRLGIGVMTDARWQQIFAFMVETGMVPKDLDYKKAYTLAFLPKPKQSGEAEAAAQAAARE